MNLEGMVNSLAAVAAAVLLLGPASPAGAQTWQKQYWWEGQPGYYYPVYPSKILETSDGGLVLTGSKGTRGAVVKLDPFGNIVWSREIFNRSANGGLFGMVETSDGGIVVTGMVMQAGRTSEGFAIIKLDAGGVVQWHKEYGQQVAGLQQRPYGGIAQTADGGFLVLGSAPQAAGVHDYWLIKTDANGDLLWQKSYGGPGNDFADYPTLGVIPQNGNVVLAGYTYSWGAGNTTDAWILFLDSGGNILSQHVFGEADYEHPATLTVASNGDVIVVAYKSPFPVLSTLSATWVLRFNSTGGLLWQKAYGLSGVTTVAPKDILELPGGDLAVLAGLSGVTPILLMRLDATGEPISAMGYQITNGGVPYRLGKTGDDGLLIAGTTNYPWPSTFVITTDSQGQVGSSCSVDATPVPFGPANVVVTDDIPVDTDAVAFSTAHPGDVFAAVTTDLLLGTEDRCGLAVPRIEAVPWRLDFGVVGTHQTATLPIEIRSTGELDLWVSAMDVPSPFGVVTSCAGTTVPAGTACTAEIEFNPPLVGTFAGNLIVASDDPATPVLTVPILGEGTDIIFQSGFEPGDTLEWSATVP